MRYPSKRENRFLLIYIFIPLLITIFYFLFYMRISDTLPIRFSDEHHWIGRSYFFELLIKRDFDNPLWKSFDAYDQPKLTEYVFGAALYPQYLREKNSLYTNNDLAKFLIDYNFYAVEGITYKNYKNASPWFVDWGESFKGRLGWMKEKTLIRKYGENFQRTLKIIFYIRHVNAIILSLALIVIYYIALLFFKPYQALIITIYYGLNKLIVTSVLLAQSEAIFLLNFSLGLLLLLLIFIRYKHNYLLLFAFSVIVALSTQTKLNGIILLILFLILMFVEIISEISTKNFKNLFNCLHQVIFVLLISSVVFVLLDPTLYSNPLKNTMTLYKQRNSIVLYQVNDLHFKKDVLPTIRDRVRAIYSNYFSSKKDSSFNVPIGVENSLLISVVNIVLFMLGIVYIIKHSIKKRFKTNKILLLFFFLFIQIITVAYLQLNWKRYFVHLSFFFILFQSMGLWLFISFVFRLLNRSLKLYRKTYRT